MSHVAAERLAGQALGETDALTSDELDHLATCPACLGELDELREVVSISTDHLSDYRPMTPGPHVWPAIDAALRSEAEGTSVAGAAPPSALPPPVHRSHAAGGSTSGASSRRTATSTPLRRPGVALLAAAVGLIVGLSGVLVCQSLRSTDATVLASTPLRALPGHTGTGNAELVQSRGTRLLRVELDAPPAGPDYRELWLINTDGERMYSLGVLPPNGADSYPIPPELAAGLQGYTIVDVSIEPYDGNSAHSRNSLVRGSLPG